VPRPSVRPLLLEAALEQFHSRGFHNCSVDDITKAAGVPKGSFYNHFASKDALAVEALQVYQQRSVWRRGEDADRPPLERLRHRFAAMRDVLTERGYTRGCLIGNMGTELADLNPAVRAEVQASLDFRSRASTELLREAQQRGELAGRLDPDVLGPFLTNAWEGVVTRTKVCKSPQAMDEFFAVLDQLFAQPKDASRP
jgi:TetR/AcrR family transcriptional repressor of nem operon